MKSKLRLKTQVMVLVAGGLALMIGIGILIQPIVWRLIAGAAVFVLSMMGVHYLLRPLQELGEEVSKIKPSDESPRNRVEQIQLDQFQPFSREVEILRVSFLQMKDFLISSWMELAATSHELEEARTTLSERATLMEEQFHEQVHELSETRGELKQARQDLVDLRDDLQEAKRQMAIVRATHSRQQELNPPRPSGAGKRILLAESDRKRRVLTKMALKGTGAELELAPTPEKAQELLNSNPYDVLCVDTEWVDLADFGASKQPDMHSVLLTSSDFPESLPIMIQHSMLSHVVARHEEDAICAQKDLLTTVGKIISVDRFGIEKYLSWGTEVKEQAILSSMGRGELVHGMEDYLKNIGIRRNVLSKCALVAEELLMNAIYDAPVDDHGKPLYNHLPRSVGVELAPTHRGRFRYACDGHFLGISAEDPFGAFHRKTVLSYLEHGFAGNTDVIHPDKGGAGLGMYQVMETADTLIINVKPRVRTEVIALFNVSPQKPKGGKRRSFHYFYG